MPSQRWVKKWIVPSLSRDKEYTVSQDYNGNWACSCPQWKFHSPRADCKHIIFIKSGDGKGFTIGEAVVRRLAGRDTERIM